MNGSRTQAQKVGRLKYIVQQLKRIDRRMSTMETDVRVLRKGLRAWLKFDRPYLERILEPTEADMAIIDCIVQQPDGALPSVVAKELASQGIQGISRWAVTSRIRRFNRILKREFGKHGFEKRGHRWAATRFFEETWGLPVEELLEV